MPNPVTTGGITTSSVLLLGEPAVVAERIGVTTVSHFRNRDLAAGGLGAPLTGFGDYVLYHHTELNRAVQNIGGIANVCLVPAHGGIDTVIGFDTGNMVVDALVNMMTGGEQQFDRDGKIASQGKLDKELLAELLADSYFSKLPPKATGRERFGVQYATVLREKGHERGLSDEDIVAVATVLTADSIALAYKQFLLPLTRLDQIIVGGGGAYNKTMMQQLQIQMDPVPVLRAEDLGISSYSREAVYAALLANETVSGRAANLPKVTGARRSVVMGAISLPS
jgi:anhydro-N-acetylmuramic acid kinase